jgi:hypothetical protein
MFCWPVSVINDNRKNDYLKHIGKTELNEVSSTPRVCQIYTKHSLSEAKLIALMDRNKSLARQMAEN